jgi:phenylalanyl-tRNA synthetase alpha chain
MKETTPEATGHLHPITIVINELLDACTRLGFEITQGPEIETEYFNFDALNVPKNHPARDMQDTFWLDGKEGMLLRTQTSAVQARYLKEHKPPVRIVVPGKVFRYEATDATHETQFFQLEGLAIDKNITLAHLKETLNSLFKILFGEQVEVRFRPSFFPFVEPGVEVDISCFVCGRKGCSLCKYSGWIEVMGAGMVHPNVLSEAGIHPRDWRGFAFGFGIDRMAMLKYGIDDIRLLYSGDLRVVNQF